MAKFPRKPTVLLSFKAESPHQHGIVDECNALGWRMVNVLYADDYMISRQSAIGAILIDVPWGGRLKQIQEIDIPIVCTMARRSEDLKPAGRVISDRYGAGRAAAEAFIERGFKHMAFVLIESENHVDPLGAALREVAERHGATTHVSNLKLDNASDGRSRNAKVVGALTEWVKQLPKPVAILAYNFKMGIRIITACEAAGLSVPEEVAIAARGNIDPLYQTAPVPLSGIDMNYHEIGRQAVQLLKRLTDGEAPPDKSIVIPVKGFVERRSTDIYAISDPLVAKAVRFMWDHMSWPMRVEDVAAEVGVSLNTLKRAFKRTLNCGVSAELRRKRLETCKELLRSTDKTLDKVAKATGFGSPRHLHRAFKSAFGMTPSEYRKSRAGSRKSGVGSLQD